MDLEKLQEHLGEVSKLHTGVRLRKERSEAERLKKDETASAQMTAGAEPERGYGVILNQFRWIFEATYDGSTEQPVETPDIKLGHYGDPELGEGDLVVSVGAWTASETDIFSSYPSYFKDATIFVVRPAFVTPTERYDFVAEAELFSTDTNMARAFETIERRNNLSLDVCRTPEDWGGMFIDALSEVKASFHLIHTRAAETLGLLVQAAGDPLLNPGLAGRVRQYYQPLQMSAPNVE